MHGGFSPCSFCQFNPFVVCSQSPIEACRDTFSQAAGTDAAAFAVLLLIGTALLLVCMAGMLQLRTCASSSLANVAAWEFAQPENKDKVVMDTTTHAPDPAE